MSCLEGLLEEAGRRFEPELQRRLGGLLGGLLRNYLPQAWVFETDAETVTLRVDASGHVTVGKGADPHPDVTIEIPHDRLAAALKTRDPAKVPPGPLSVTPHTAKGKAAFDYLRSRIGL
ncbi:MAG TPA: hypothetical protein VMC82_05455 [Thermoplasmata archaeon]|nr:hypothetical protein [Thermoplasmata archaeon]